MGNWLVSFGDFCIRVFFLVQFWNLFITYRPILSAIIADFNGWCISIGRTLNKANWFYDFTYFWIAIIVKIREIDFIFFVPKTNFFREIKSFFFLIFSIGGQENWVIDVDFFPQLMWHLTIIKLLKTNTYKVANIKDFFLQNIVLRKRKKTCNRTQKTQNLKNKIAILPTSKKKGWFLNELIMRSWKLQIFFSKFFFCVFSMQPSSDDFCPLHF